MVPHHNKLQIVLSIMNRRFDIFIGCNSALIWIRLHPDPDPVKIRIRPDTKSLDPVKLTLIHSVNGNDQFRPPAESKPLYQSIDQTGKN